MAYETGPRLLDPENDPRGHRHEGVLLPHLVTWLGFGAHRERRRGVQNPRFPATTRRRNRTFQAWDCHALPVLKTGWATRPVPRRVGEYGDLRAFAARRACAAAEPSDPPPADRPVNAPATDAQAVQRGSNPASGARDLATRARPGTRSSPARRRPGHKQRRRRAQRRGHRCRSARTRPGSARSTPASQSSTRARAGHRARACSSACPRRRCRPPTGRR